MIHIDHEDCKAITLDIMAAAVEAIVGGSKRQIKKHLKSAIRKYLEVTIQNVFQEFRPLTWRERLRPRLNLLEWVEDFFDIDGGRWFFNKEFLEKLEEVDA